jgi:hypothetical protein
MALMTPEQFEASLKGRKPRVFMNGKRVDSVLENPNTRTVVEANKASYQWALDPKYKDIMTCRSPLIGETVNRYTHASASIDDLVSKARAGTFTSEMLGTCIYRCVGYDAFHSLAATTWEMDQKLGTEYHPRFTEYLKMVQKNDLSVAGALTEPRGSRKKKTLDWPDPYLSLKITEKRMPLHLPSRSTPRVLRIFANTPPTLPKESWPTISMSWVIPCSGSEKPPWWFLITCSSPGKGSFTAANPSFQASLCPASHVRTV